MKVRKKRIVLGENQKKVLLAIGLGTLVVASLALPNLPIAIQPLIKARGSKFLKKLLQGLEKKRFISLGKEKIKLTAKGKKMLKQIEIFDMKIEKPEKWDGFWRLVSYDVPEKYRKSRDIFREILEQNDFFQIHKSLWVNPYPCREEVAVTAKKLHLSSDVILMETEKLPNEKDMQDHFGLSNSS